MKQKRNIGIEKVKSPKKDKRPITSKKNSTCNTERGNARKKASVKKNLKKGLEEEMPLPEPKPIEAVQKIPQNKINDDNNEEEEKVPEVPFEGAKKYEFNLYKHLKENIKNKDKLCIDGITPDTLYCVNCKTSCCPKCPHYDTHNGHELVQKLPYYKCEKDFINESFKDLDSIFNSNPTYLNVEKIKNDLKTHITDQISQLINQLNEVKDKKLEEIDNVFVGNENCVEKLKESETKLKQNLFNFFEKQKKFFCIDLNEGVDSDQVNQVLKNLE